MKSTKRWYIYALAGILFGLLDWYYLALLAHFPWGSLGTNPAIVPLIILLNYGVWLVPVVPVTYNESHVSRVAWAPALAGAFTWSCSIVSYYVYYTLLLAFWGLPNMEHLLILGEKPPGFWQEWQITFQRIILNQVVECLPIALVGGSVAGVMVWFLVVRLRTARPGASTG